MHRSLHRKFELRPDFSSPLHYFQVTEAGKDSLPDWLHFDQDANSLKGVPSTDDLGHLFYIQVTAKGQGVNNSQSEATDIFAIRVIKDDVHSDAIPLKDISHSSLKPIKCVQGSSVTMVTIVVDADLSDMSGSSRLHLMEELCDHLGMPIGLLRLLPMGNKPMFDSAALVAGPGDVKEPQYEGAALEWEVGCGNVQAAHMPILTKLESTSSDGSMSRAIGHGIVGWHVTNNKPPAPKRLKRQAQINPTATPGLSVGLPTQRPTMTVTVTDTDMPTSREVPSMASPTFTEIEPTTSSSSRHKHRTKTKGRHHKTKHPKLSPTRTSVPQTVSVTMTHIMPTRVIESTATLEPTVSHVMPSFAPSSPGVSHSFVEPSMMPTMTVITTSSSSEPTEYLPTTHTFEHPHIVTSSSLIRTTEAGMATPSTDAPALKPTPSLPSGALPPTEKFNFPPIVKNYLRPYKITEGDILNLPIPEDTFNDYEDGNSRNLKLVLMTMDGLTMSPISWIQLNATSQTLYGLPREYDIGKHDYLLAAIDSGGKLSRLVFEMTVERRPRDHKISHEFSLTLDLNFKVFLLSVDKQINVANKIAKLYGDPDTQMISVTKMEAGSVRYAWTNNSLPTDECPIREISGLVSYLITPDNTLNPKLIEAMDPIDVQKAGLEPKGVCEDYPLVAEVGTDEGGEGTGPKNVDGEEEEGESERGEGGGVESERRETSDEDVLITTVIPAVVIAAMLLIAGLIACILYRKKRKGKLSDEDQHTFINKGIPIIFSDELEEHPDRPTKPLILADEKPPLPPPDYHSASGSVLSTPRSDHKEPLIDSVTTDEESEMSPYHPPPPVTGSLGQRGSRHNHQPAYRSPPPYVPP